MSLENFVREFRLNLETRISICRQLLTEHMGNTSYNEFCLGAGEIKAYEYVLSVLYEMECEATDED